MRFIVGEAALIVKFLIADVIELLALSVQFMLQLWEPAVRFTTLKLVGVLLKTDTLVWLRMPSILKEQTSLGERLSVTLKLNVCDVLLEL